MEKRIGCLLLHGYGGSPFEFNPVQERLEQAGFFVHCPVLPGHCQSMEAFCQTRFTDWAEAARQAFVQVGRQVDKVVVIGLSMGGSLGLWLAEQYPLAGLVTISAPVFLYRFFPWWVGSDLRLPLVPWVRFFKPVLFVPKPSPESNEIAPHRGYEGFQALHPLASLLKGLKEIRQGLAKVVAPLLVIHSPQDQTVPVANSWEIVSKVRSRRRSLELIPILEQITSRHLLTTHMESKERVGQAVFDFVQDLYRS